jgi:hypothetical protein
VQPVGDAELPFDVACLALLVDQQADHRGTMFDREAKHSVRPRSRAVSVLKVRRVENGSAADVLQPGFEHGRLR